MTVFCYTYSSCEIRPTRPATRLAFSTFIQSHRGGHPGMQKSFFDRETKIAPRVILFTRSKKLNENQTENQRKNRTISRADTESLCVVRGIVMSGAAFLSPRERERLLPHRGTFRADDSSLDALLFFSLSRRWLMIRCAKKWKLHYFRQLNYVPPSTSKCMCFIAIGDLCGPR